ncbi:hypothetical protein AB834_03890 [PVC group bacterium (ex Bugula neritina AB1)]|nr:hypothetical protein AB834_03890 [PVC group bacterium (ex Bugula neritina AB1)]
MKSFVIITGGLDGLGYDLCSFYLKRGHDVFLSYFTDDDFHEKNFLTLDSLGKVERCHMDLRDQVSIDHFFDRCLREKCPDIWINNAGVSYSSLTLRLSGNDFDDMFKVNAQGTAYLSRKIAFKMALRKKGHILNVISHQAYGGRSMGLSGYAFSKGYLLGFTKDLAEEYGVQNIQCNAICPGFMKTRMSKFLTKDSVEKYRLENTLKDLASMESICQSVYDISFWPQVSGQTFVLDSRVL